MIKERKINAMVDIAEKDRRLREIEEAGKRQAEEKLREREDVMYNEILRVHQGTVDTQLDWIFSDTLERGNIIFLICQLLPDKLQLWLI